MTQEEKNPIREEYNQMFDSLPLERQAAHLRVLMGCLLEELRRKEQQRIDRVAGELFEDIDL